MKINEELAELIGCFMGDGGVHNSKNSHYLIYFTGHSKLDVEYYRNKIIPIIVKYFNLKASIKKVKGKNAINVVFNSKKLYYFFLQSLKLNQGRKSDIIEVPGVIRDDETLFRRLIRGLYDTDGGVFLDKREVYSKPYPRLFYHTISKVLHIQLKDYLSKYFNFYSYRRVYKNSNYNDLYSLEIYGKKNLYKWMQIIGFSNKRHLDKVALVA